MAFQNNRKNVHSLRRAELVKKSVIGVVIKIIIEMFRSGLEKRRAFVAGVSRILFLEKNCFSGRLVNILIRSAASRYFRELTGMLIRNMRMPGGCWKVAIIAMVAQSCSPALRRASGYCFNERPISMSGGVASGGVAFCKSQFLCML